MKWTAAQHPLWRWLLWGGTLANVAVLLCAHFLPFTDLPEHVAMISTLRHWNDPAWNLQEYFTLALGQTQYLLYYVAGAALAYPLADAERGNLALLVAIAIAWPFSLKSLLKAARQDERLALFAVPVFWNQSLLIGFFNYLAAIPVVLWALAAVIKQAQSPKWTRALLLALTGVALFYLHLSALVFFLPVAVLCTYVLVPNRSLKQTVSRLVWTLPVGLLSLQWLIASPVTNPSKIGWVKAVEPHWETPWANVRALHFSLLHMWQGPLDGWFFALLIVAGAALQFPPRFRQALTPARRMRWLLAACAGWAAFLYFAMPSTLGWLAHLNGRYAIVTVLFFAACVRPPSGLKGATVMLAVAAIGFASAGNAMRMMHQFEAESVGFDNVLNQAQRGKKLLALIYDESSKSVRFYPYHHFGAYYRVRKGGVAEHSFVDLPQAPVRYRPDRAPPVRPFGWELYPGTFVNAEHGGYFDYILVRGDEGAFQPGSEGPKWRRVAHEGRWTLYAQEPI
ncbi:MAG: hypothetical protein K1X64_03975 [Myxococcaceae bacterium]|nr:hypothetical protein [Myxococcaceae bacterium]